MRWNRYLSSEIIVALLASHFFGGVAGQEESEAPTAAPNDCDGLVAGDIYFTSVSSKAADEVVFFLFEDIPGDLSLYLTDNAWTGTTFQSNEGTLEFTTPAAGLPGGTNFGFGPNYQQFEWTVAEGTFALDDEGEQVFLYCFGGAGDPIPLAAISYNGPFKEAGLSSYGLDESALPERLATNGTIELEQCDFWRYDGVQSAEKNELRAAMQNTINWKGGGCASSACHWLKNSSFLQVLLLGALTFWMAN